MYKYSYEHLNRLSKSKKGRKVIEEFKEIYVNKYENKPIIALNYSYVKRFYEDGNRKLHETEYFDRRVRLMLLQVLAVSDDEYIKPLEEIIAAICDEFTWVLPAHNLNKDNTFDYTVIDLFSAETAMYLAETAYVFGDKLSPDIRNRIQISVEEKIIKNYELKEHYFELTLSNWAAVCSCGIGLSYLYLFPDRFEKVKGRLFKAFNHYIDGLDGDGYCAEGMSYWDYGFGYFCVFFDVYMQITGEKPDILNSEKVINTLKYCENARLDDCMYLPYADGGHKEFYFKTGVIYAVKNLFPEDFDLPDNIRIDTTSRALGFRFIYGATTFDKAIKREAVYPQTIYYSHAETFIRKFPNYCFSVKCGNNGDMHNHNDVGAFTIVSDSKRLIADLGGGEYCWKYFFDISETGRYGKEIFVCSSLSHSVPIVDGKAQMWGKEYRGKVIDYGDDFIRMDISGAYKEKISELAVEYRATEKNIAVAYSCKGIKDHIIFRFVSDLKPEITDNEVKIGKMTIKNGMGILPVSEAVSYRTYGSVETAYTLDYKVSGESNVNVVFTFEL